MYIHMYMHKTILKGLKPSVIGAIKCEDLKDISGGEQVRTWYRVKVSHQHWKPLRKLGAFQERGQNGGKSVMKNDRGWSFLLCLPNYSVFSAIMIWRTQWRTHPLNLRLIHSCGKCEDPQNQLCLLTTLSHIYLSPHTYFPTGECLLWVQRRH